MNRRDFIARLGLGAAAVGSGLTAPATEVMDGPLPPSGSEPALARGWNTWSTQSVLTHVCLPEAFALKLSFCHFGMLAWVRDAVFGRKELGATAGVHLSGAQIAAKTIQVQPGRHAYDGAYTALHLTLGEASITVESAHDGPDGMVLWIACTGAEHRPPALVVEPGMLWNRPGVVRATANEEWRVNCPGREWKIHATAAPVDEPNLTATSPAWVFPLGSGVGISAGAARSAADIRRILDEARAAEEAAHARYGSAARAHAAIQSGLAWNTIYDPQFRRLLTTSSRAWNIARFGYGIFCWDGFFYGWMVGADNPPLARAAVLEMFRGMIGDEFVPNVLNGSGRRSADRSQPCVGGLAILAMCEAAPDPAFLDQAWPHLLRWNRWWHRQRRNAAGGLSWGSEPVPIEIGDLAETLQPNTARGASLESGMDNTPMYDGVPFDDRRTHLQALSDVGLMSLYVTDCQALAKLAALRGDAAAESELTERARAYGENLRGLWNSGAGVFANRRTDTGEFSNRISPTSFYPLLAGVATADQARQLVDGHLLNPRKFWGEWPLPSVPRDDPAFAEQVYWRGRVWAPLNFLTYLGLKRAGMHDAARQLAAKSRHLFEFNYEATGGIYENYSPLDGVGGGVLYSDPLCPWSGLLVFMDLIERQLVPLPSLLRPASGPATLPG